ncbi:MAG: DUF1284 domain-containing protein [Candidatus Bathyarchaeia archaeon]|nr:DUF1284 domain-containing protein [Candidatus Bathyarchaeota archaeon]
MLNLRAHHLLCLIVPDFNDFNTTARKKFKEKGYTDNYINAYMKAFNIARTNRTEEIRVLDRPMGDDTCAHCSNYIDGRCVSSYASVFANWDREILSILGLKVNDVIKVQDLVRLVKEKVDPKNMPGVCQGCLFNLDGRCRERLASANI